MNTPSHPAISAETASSASPRGSENGPTGGMSSACFTHGHYQQAQKGLGRRSGVSASIAPICPAHERHTSAAVRTDQRHAEPVIDGWYGGPMVLEGCRFETGRRRCGIVVPVVEALED